LYSKSGKNVPVRHIVRHLGDESIAFPVRLQAV